MNSTRFSMLLVVLTIALVSAGCGGTDDDPLGSGGGDVGRLTVMVHDAPSDQIAEAWVTFDSLVALAADGTEYPAELSDPRIDLAALVNGADAAVADGLIPAGDYVGVRMVISVVELVLDDGSTASLDLGAGLPVEVRKAFTVTTTDGTVISVDMPLGAFQLVSGAWVFDSGMVSAD